MPEVQNEFDLQDVKVDLVDPAKAKKDDLTYEFPYWSNKEHRHLIVTAVTPTGQKRIMSIMDRDGTNPDMQLILSQYTEEDIDKNTEDSLKRRNENIKRQMERREAQAARAKQEQLFGAKLEAFEIEEIKNSKNSEFKRLIRKSKSPMEVAAYCTLLLNEERALDPLVRAKNEALEMLDIKQSRNPLKKKIHSAETVTEVMLYATLILQKEIDNAKKKK